MDQESYEVKYGLRAESEDHLIGPWDCTPVDKRVTLEGWEGFMAVQEEPGSWALYFDQDDNGLTEKTYEDEKVLEVELIRKERRKSKDNEG